MTAPVKTDQELRALVKAYAIAFDAVRASNENGTDVPELYEEEDDTRDAVLEAGRALQKAGKPAEPRLDLVFRIIAGALDGDTEKVRRYVEFLASESDEATAARLRKMLEGGGATVKPAEQPATFDTLHEMKEAWRDHSQKVLNEIVASERVTNEDMSLRIGVEPAEQPAPLTPEEKAVALMLSRVVPITPSDMMPFAVLLAVQGFGKRVGVRDSGDVMFIPNERGQSLIDRLNAEKSRDVCGAYSDAESVARTGRPGGCTKPKGHEGNCGDTEEAKGCPLVGCTKKGPHHHDDSAIKEAKRG